MRSLVRIQYVPHSESPRRKSGVFPLNRIHPVMGRTFAEYPEMLRTLRPFIIFASLLVLAAFALEHLNGRFWLNDFRVYYMAADNLRHGLPIYNVVFGEDTGLYKYVPFALYFFIPLTFLPYTVAAAVHFLLMGIMLMACFVVIERTLVRIGGPVRRPALRATLGLLCIAVLLVRELHLGNINLGLILLAYWGVERHLAGKPLPAGIALGVAWLIKPYLLLMLVPLVVRREWKVVRTAFASMLAGILLPMLQEGPAGWWSRLSDWVDAIVRHNKTIESPDTITSMLSSNFNIPPSFLLGLAIIAVAGILVALFTWTNMRRPAGSKYDLMDRALELWLACAVVPNLVITDQQHFMFSLPLILYILAWLFTRKDRWSMVLLIVTMLLYATRSSDLWGSGPEHFLAGHGVLGSGNLFLIALVWLVHSRWTNRSGATPHPHG